MREEALGVADEEVRHLPASLRPAVHVSWIGSQATQR
jgi:hypothetical protein